MASFGFIITRHVNSEKTNKYWNRCVKCIKTFHQGIKIIIIDDNSDYKFVKPDIEYENVEIVQSEYPGRGELLPYYYFWKNHYWQNAVIMHDSVFIHRRVAFRRLRANVMPLWHFNGPTRNENFQNSLRIIRNLKNNHEIRKSINVNNHDVSTVMNIQNKNNNWNGVFGVQSYINYNFLCKLQQKYQIFNMLQTVHSRPDRCCLERIMGVLFSLEDPIVRLFPSLFGDITKTPDNFGLTYDGYMNQINQNGKPKSAYVKVWTGR